MSRVLRLARDLTVPVAAVSRTFGILAVRGAGKSNTAAVMAEEMFAAGLPFVVVDPVGSWWGLRSSADGKAPGLPIPIFGGKHGDVQLERGAGDLLADLIVEKRLSCVLDLSRFDSEGDKKAFLLAFARRLYQTNEEPLHLFLEEADDYIPQKPFRDEAQLLRAWENIVRRGRARGLGITLITHRSASVNKMVLTQVETLFAMRTTGPHGGSASQADRRRRPDHDTEPRKVDPTRKQVESKVDPLLERLKQARPVAVERQVVDQRDAAILARLKAGPVKTYDETLAVLPTEGLDAEMQKAACTTALRRLMVKGQIRQVEGEGWRLA